MSELMVIDRMIQCIVCKRHNAKGLSLCTCGVILQESSAEKTKTLKHTTAQVMIRFSGLQWRVGTRGLDQALQSSTPRSSNRKASFRTAQNKNFEGCADRWGKRRRLSKVHPRKQPHVRNHGQLGQNRKWTTQNHKMTPRLTQTQVGTRGMS